MPRLPGQPEARETRWRANTDAMREARAWEERETRWRANAEAMRDARARRLRIADRSGSTVVHAVHTKVAETSEATCILYIYVVHINDIHQFRS